MRVLVLLLSTHDHIAIKIRAFERPIRPPWTHHELENRRDSDGKMYRLESIEPPHLRTIFDFDIESKARERHERANMYGLDGLRRLFRKAE